MPANASASSISGILIRILHDVRHHAQPSPQRRQYARRPPAVSRAFVKEADGDAADGDLPERQVSAQLVERDPASQQVGIGSAVEVVDDSGAAARYAIVGEDEADVARGLVSWVSPLARALLRARIGDTVIWQRPDGARNLEITAIEALDLPAV